MYNGEPLHSQIAAQTISQLIPLCSNCTFWIRAMPNVTAGSGPHQLITTNNHGGYITITAALMTVWMVLFYIIRIIVRLAFSNILASDDILVTVGTVRTTCGFPSSVSWTDDCNRSLGLLNQLSPLQLFMKASANMLTI
jgi:hypothetical protein